MSCSTCGWLRPHWSETRVFPTQRRASTPPARSIVSFCGFPHKGILAHAFKAQQLVFWLSFSTDYPHACSPSFHPPPAAPLPRLPASFHWVTSLQMRLWCVIGKQTRVFPFSCAAFRSGWLSERWLFLIPSGLSLHRSCCNTVILVELLKSQLSL